MSSKRENFLRQFRDLASNELVKLTANQFMEIWTHYDQDSNGYIEGKELDNFLSELCTSVSSTSDTDSIPENIFLQFKETMLEAYDENEDGKISVQELAELLPTEENFLFIFRYENSLESCDFMKIWIEFDKDKSGFIESDELSSFVRKLLETQNDKKNEVSDEKLDEYVKSIIKIFDKNGDGKLQLSEMIRLLSPRENLGLKTILSSFSGIKKEELDQLFDTYDKDGNQSIQDEEIDALTKDLMNLMKEDYTTEDFEVFRKGILKLGDVNKDGKISKSELHIILMTFASKNLEN